jgi:hypothetical protein
MSVSSIAEPGEPCCSSQNCNMWYWIEEQQHTRFVIWSCHPGVAWLPHMSIKLLCTPSGFITALLVYRPHHIGIEKRCRATGSIAAAAARRLSYAL